jgi:hypothetical protein
MVSDGFLRPKKEVWEFDRELPINYDSRMVFPNEKDAMSYFPVFIRSLLELGLLVKDQPYETSLVELQMFDKEM